MALIFCFSVPLLKPSQFPAIPAFLYTYPMTATATHTVPNQAAPSNDQPLLSVKNLKTYFPVKRGLMRRTVGHVRAVDDVSFDIGKRETLGLVGESGCGKSTVGRTILRLIPATEGSVHYEGLDVLAKTAGEMKRLRQQMQIIFQDPVGSLNPRMTVGRIIGEPIVVHKLASGSELRDRVATLLSKVGLEPDHAFRYPHEFSGGQRQRIGIARALALQPKLIICDEPTSALDVSVQAQILNLLRDLQQQRGLSYLFISHDLAVVRHMADDIAVMQHGKIVEQGSASQIVDQPQHEYTRQLLDAVLEVAV